MNIPQSTLDPFGVIGIPLFNMWNEAAGKYLTERELWQYVHDCLRTYFRSMAEDGSYTMKPSDIEKIVASITRTLGVDSASCTHQHWNTNHNNAFTVIARYNGKSRYYDHILPERLLPIKVWDSVVV